MCSDFEMSTAQNRLGLGGNDILAVLSGVSMTDEISQLLATRLIAIEFSVATTAPSSVHFGPTSAVLTSSSRSDCSSETMFVEAVGHIRPGVVAFRRRDPLTQYPAVPKAAAAASLEIDTPASSSVLISGLHSTTGTGTSGVLGSTGDRIAGGVMDAIGLLIVHALAANGKFTGEG